MSNYHFVYINDRLACCLCLSIVGYEDKNTGGES